MSENFIWISYEYFNWKRYLENYDSLKRYYDIAAWVNISNRTYSIWYNNEILQSRILKVSFLTVCKNHNVWRLIATHRISIEFLPLEIFFTMTHYYANTSPTCIHSNRFFFHLGNKRTRDTPGSFFDGTTMMGSLRTHFPSLNHSRITPAWSYLGRRKGKCPFNNL